MIINKYCRNTYCIAVFVARKELYESQCSAVDKMGEPQSWYTDSGKSGDCLEQ